MKPRRGRPNDPIPRDGWGPYRIERSPRVPGAVGALAAWDERNERAVELELLHGESEDALIERARSLAAIEHPNLARVYGAERLGGRVFLVAERVDGRSFDELLGEEHALEPAVVLEVVRSVAAALTFLHRAGGAHGGVDPSRIVRESGTGRVLLRGLARWVDGLGWPDISRVPEEHVAPEVADRASVAPELRAREDVYGLAATAFELLTGRPADEEGRLAALLDERALEEPPRASAIRPSLSWHVDRVLLAAMREQPDERTATPLGFADDLAGAIEREGARPRILVADDDADHRQLVALALAKRLGPIDLDLAPDGEQAYRAALERSPDLAVLDLDMPRMNGLELTIALRSLPTLERLPIMIVSGGLGPREREVLARLRVDRCFAKPVALTRIASAARELLGYAIALPSGQYRRASVLAARARKEAG